METIELEQGWLARQMKEVRREVQSWPEVLKPLTTINSSLVHSTALNDNLTQQVSTPKPDAPKSPE
jgi:hypothetical protein